MRSNRVLWCVAAMSGLLSVRPLKAQAQPVPSGTPTFHATSRLVFLDVTVLDSKGHPVVKGLTRNDFTITESRQPRPIFSFDAPEAHTDTNPADDNPSGKAPATVFVLDLLNSRFEDFAYIREQARKYLASQPDQLSSRAELMVLGNRSLELLQGYTTSREDLLDALDHLPPALPYKLNGSFVAERFAQSIDALQQIALQNKGVPRRKTIVWVGHGGPGLFTEALAPSDVEEIKQYVHDTTNMLVDARMTLFVIYPGLRVSGGFSFSATSADTMIGDDDPFSGDINFGVFVNETGGNLFYNHNDIAAEMRRSRDLGSEYYTLTYEPQVGPADGKFRRVRVSVRDRSLRVLTKAGYFAPDADTPVHPRKQRLVDISEAVRSTIPMPALTLKTADLVRHPDSGRVEFTVLLRSGNIAWQAADDGRSTANLMLAAASLNDSGDVLASKAETLTASAAGQDAARLGETVIRIPVRLRVPPKTRLVRVVAQAAENGRLGSVELNSAALAAAPETPTRVPTLQRRPEPAKR
ncbi:MAG TPA: VWA domain-containing protein [Candidatus Sulfopaludibacter sp.]|nr:VWA domain-containing protein [Candidatus Sulfopaludibacter sp.]